jgi:hypothetical protein
MEDLGFLIGSGAGMLFFIMGSIVLWALIEKWNFQERGERNVFIFTILGCYSIAIVCFVKALTSLW